jgi:hypothetical protein
MFKLLEAPNQMRDRNMGVWFGRENGGNKGISCVDYKSESLNRRSPPIKVGNRKHPAMSRVMDAFG